MDFRQLRYFVSVAELESFSRAAARLNVAQSALSRHMQLLESELGVRLLDRHGRGARPNAAGKVLLRRATKLLGSLDEARHAVVAAGTGPAGLVRLAVPPSVSQYFAAPSLEACAEELPHVTLKLFEAWTGHIMEWLVMGQCDLGIIYSSQVDDQVTFRSIFTEELKLIVSSDNRSLIGRGAYELHDVAALPLIVPPHPHGLRRVIEAAFAEYDLTPNFAYEAEVWSVFKELLHSGVAQAIMPPSEVSSELNDGRMIAIPIVNPVVQRTLGISMSADRRPSPPVRAVFDMVCRESSNWCAGF